MKFDCRVGLPKSVVLSVAAAALLAVGFPAAQAQEQKASSSADAVPAGDVAHGKAMFMRDGCYHCHGFGAAGTGAAPALLANPIPIEVFIAYVRHPARTMPPFTEKVISDKDLTDIFAFIHSLPKPRDAKSIPMLNE
jgi:mono/diheme cytochrome c family protein